MGAEFKDRVKELRQQRGALQKDIAEYLGISIRAYQHYETGTRYPDFAGINKLSDFFGVSTDYLLGRKFTIKQAVHFRGLLHGYALKAFDAPPKEGWEENHISYYPESFNPINNQYNLKDKYFESDDELNKYLKDAKQNRFAYVKIEDEKSCT